MEKLLSLKFGILVGELGMVLDDVFNDEKGQECLSFIDNDSNQFVYNTVEKAFTFNGDFTFKEKYLLTGFVAYHEI